MFTVTDFNTDISAWGVSGVTSTMAMFAANKNFNGNVSAWSVSKAMNMVSMFYQIAASG